LVMCTLSPFQGSVVWCLMIQGGALRSAPGYLLPRLRRRFSSAFYSRIFAPRWNLNLE